MISRAFSCVDSKITGGAHPASAASSHRLAHKHHRSPAFNPKKLYSGRGVLKSFPCAFENNKNSSFTSAQTV